MTTTRVTMMTSDAIRRTARYVSSCGGTRSGKTFAMLQCILALAEMDTRPTITSVVSETFPHLKRGAIRDFKAIIGERWDEAAWSQSNNAYTLPNGSVIEFFSADSPAKVHGPARDRLFLNEVQNIPFDTARQLFVRTRKLILMDYNPTHSFWADQRIEVRPDCVTIHSTYLDNVDWETGDTTLSPEQVAEIESNRDDRNWWTVYGEGKVGTLEGLIYDFEMIDAMPTDGSLREVYGMDFGFTNDPTAIVRVLADTGRKILYVDERCYRTRMLNADIAAFLAADGVTRAVEVIADCAEPKSIEDIARNGFRITPCDKDAPVRSEKRVFQIHWLQGWKLRVTKDSVNLIRELRNYTWAQDRDGNPLNVPIDGFDHCLDALRYATWTKFADGEGNYIIGFRKKPVPRNPVKRKAFVNESEIINPYKQRNHR